MKRAVFVFWLIGLLFTGAAAGESRGKVMRSLSFRSEILDTTVNYSIYLPAGYDESQQKYPALYLLHGYTDNENTWIDNGWVDQAADQGILSREVEPMVIIMPNGWLKWYVNQPNGDFNYEDMFIEELIPYMEKTYRLKKSKKYRFIGGLSMGGFGSLGYSMRHPELFSSCISYSAAIRPDDEILAVPQADFDELYEPVYGKGVVGKARLSKHWNENNPIFLADKIPAEKLRSVNWYITVGDDDWLYYGNSVLNNIFRLKKVPREYRVYDGKHNWVYWRGHIGEGLRFITKYLREEE